MVWAALEALVESWWEWEARMMENKSAQICWGNQPAAGLCGEKSAKMCPWKHGKLEICVPWTLREFFVEVGGLIFFF